MFKVRALYDFEGEADKEDLSFQVGEEITVTDTDNEESGWFKGVSSDGVYGSFPVNYVEKIDEDNSDWRGSTYTENDENEDWDESSETGTVMQDGEVKAIGKKGIGLFNSFAKSGGDSFLLGELGAIAVREDDRVVIKMFEDKSIKWIGTNENYSVQITKPKQETKFKGLKSFTAYQLTPSFNNIQVSRRYKHFDWLYERLNMKFHLLAIPPLPDKQIHGRFTHEFVEHRRAQLQEFVAYLCRHPVISKSDLLYHFLTCTDEKLWKKGKRQAENDPINGCIFCLCVDAPEQNLPSSTGDLIEKSKLPYIQNLEISFKTMLITSTEVSKKYKTLYTRDITRIGESFFALGSAMEIRNKAVPCKTAQLCKEIARSYLEISQLYSTQPNIDWDPFSDKMYLWKGISASLHTVGSVNREAQNKRKEYAKTNNGTTLTDINVRADVFNYITLAEINHIDNQIDTDLKECLRRHVKSQIEFYQRIVNILQKTLDEF